MSFFTRLFQTSPDADYKALINAGAQIVDVRTPDEFRSGHIRNAVNIPLQQLMTQAKSLKKDKPVIVYCASGNRSATAKRQLEASGFSMVYNAGGVNALRQQLA
jgi:rhodanese-related sulfurtransferase